MAFEPGGRADKLGNRYEGRWVAKQLVRVLNEEIRSVTIEAVGDDEKGVDLWIETKQGTREAHQCKARNASNERWDISDLNGVLEHLRFQLDRMPGHEFVFVSAVPATKLGDLCDSARNSNGPEDFYQFQVKDVGKSRLETFQKFCQYLSINDDETDGRRRVYNYLRRSRIILFPDDGNTWNDLLSLAGFHFTGAPVTIIKTLLSYVEDHDYLGKPIYADELNKYLETQGIYPKNLARDTRINPIIHQLRIQFKESISPFLIDKELIHREETGKCLEALQSNSVVILHGAAGSGKSAVLYEITQKLLEENIPFLPVRLDRREPGSTSAHFGEGMGLPGSPSHCLAAVSGGRHCVLILDQLDAVRWTGRHSANALDVCKEMVSQVMSLRREGRVISVVLSCRTFDLDHDPQIQNWLNDEKEKDRIKIKVQSLPETTVREKVGESYGNMTDRQRAILSIPQNLDMWVKLRKSKNFPSFQSVTELMKNFWTFRRSQVEKIGIAADEINAVLNCLVHWLDEQGKISAPYRVIFNCSTNTVDVLKSHGIIQEQNGMVSFCHQSYLDFLIAQRLLTQIDTGGTILDWLGPKERQTLFRREQLRQALTLLSDESPAKFLKSVKQVLSAENIRFHLKHLVLELIGQIEDVSTGMADYCLELLNDDYWKSHIVETVFLGNAVFIKSLVEKDLIPGWLNSGNNELIDRALKLLQSVAEKIPDLVTAQLEPFIDKGGEWPQKVLNTICWNIDKDSEAMFELHLKLARKGILPNFIDWKAISSVHPIRAILLIEAILSIWNISDDFSFTQVIKIGQKLEQWFKIQLTEVSKVVENNPEKTWEMFIPHVERLTSFESTPYDERLKKWRNGEIEGYSSSRGITMARAVVELLIITGKKLAKEKPEILLKWTQPLENNVSIIIQEIIMKVYPYLAAEYANAGINWLLAEVSRFSFGNKLRILDKPQWQPAECLIKALSPYCTNEVFVKLEHAIMHYHYPDKKNFIKKDLTDRRNVNFDHYWYAQYFLLPALASDRIQNSTHDRITFLKCKFAGYPEWRFVGIGSDSGGLIGSKLDQNLERISDRAWLNIIANKKITENGMGKWKQVSKDKAVESSIWQFSRSLAIIAKWYPERFVRLALQFPEDTDSKYISAIFEAMAQTKPGPDVPETERNYWKPAAIDTILKVWNRFHNLDNTESAKSFCWLIRSRADEEFPDSVIEKLLYYAANHPDLEPGKLNISCDKNAEDVDVETLFQNTINCVRGVAAEAIGVLLWHHPDLWSKLKPGIQALVSDPHPVIRMAAIKPLISLLRIDREQAVEWFCELSREDLRVPASHYAIKFFNYTISEFSHQLSPLVSRMIDSNFTDVSQRAAELATAYYLVYGFFSEELNACRKGTLPQRKGAAKIAAEFIHDERYAEKCSELLAHFFNDPDKEVRDETCSIFSDNFFDKQENIPLAEQFIRSKAFADHVSVFFHHFKDYKGSLLHYHMIILDICKEITTTLVKSSQDYQSSINYTIRTKISPLLLRLYEQAQEDNPELANRCLDIWDEFFEKRVGMTRDLTKAIENN